MQLSVFLVRADRAGLAEILEGLARRIHPKADDVRAYRVGPGALTSLAAPCLPRGIASDLAAETRPRP